MRAVLFIINKVCIICSTSGTRGTRSFSSLDPRIFFRGQVFNAPIRWGGIHFLSFVCVCASRVLIDRGVFDRDFYFLFFCFFRLYTRTSLERFLHATQNYFLTLAGERHFTKTYVPRDSLSTAGRRPVCRSLVLGTSSLPTPASRQAAGRS